MFIMTDKELIEKLGGVFVLSKHLKMKYQRVFNWSKRGIPAQIKIDYPDLFLTNNPPNLKASHSTKN